MENEEYIKDWVSKELAPEYTLSNQTLVRESSGNTNVAPFASQLHRDLSFASKHHHFKASGAVDFAFQVMSHDRYRIANGSNRYLVIIETKKDVSKQRALKNRKLNLTSNATANYADNGAVWYAKCIQKAQRLAHPNKDDNVTFPRIFAIGVSGDESQQVIHPYYVDIKGRVKKAKTSVNGVNDLTAFKAPNIDEYYRVAVENRRRHDQSATVHLKTFATRLHNDIRTYASLHNEDKAPLVAGILLALYSNNLDLDELKGHNDSETNDGVQIYNAIKSFLSQKVQQSHSKFSTPEAKALADSFSFIRSDPNLYRPKTNLNYHSPLYKFVEDLRQVEAQIKSSADVDILGNFYDEFVKYNDKDGNDLGIVLTPHHITELMSALIDIKYQDHVLDPVAGSGSFLISSMARMKHRLKADPNITHDQLKADNAYIMNKSLYGVERSPKIYSVAVSNMILRGDGNSNIMNEDSFDIPARYGKNHNINKILMNPPYSQGKKGNKGEPEIDFIRHAVDILNTNKDARPWKLAAIVPISAVVSGGKGVTSSKFKKWKKFIYDSCQIRAIMTMNPNTFYPTGTQTVIIILQSSSDGNSKPTLLFNYTHDGYKVIAKHGLSIVDPKLMKARRKALIDTVQGAATNPMPNGKFLQRVQLTPDNGWLFNAHYTNPNPPTKNDFERVVADYLTFKTNMVLHGKKYLFENNNKKKNDGKDNEHD